MLLFGKQLHFFFRSVWEKKSPTKGLSAPESQGPGLRKPGFDENRPEFRRKEASIWLRKEVSVSRKCLLLFEISPNVFQDYSYCFRSEAQKWTESFRLLL